MITVTAHCELTFRDIIQASPVCHIPDAETTLRNCIYRSREVRYGFVDDELACIWGLIPPTFLSSAAYLWLLTTNIVAENKFLFVRHSQRYVEEALKTYPILVGDVLIDNEPAKRWLKWLGARFETPPTQGLLVSKRLNFVITGKDNG